MTPLEDFARRLAADTSFEYSAVLDMLRRGGAVGLEPPAVAAAVRNAARLGDRLDYVEALLDIVELGTAGRRAHEAIFARGVRREVRARCGS